MAISTDQFQAVQPKQRRWPARAWIAGGFTVALLAGVGIGAGANSNAGALHTALSASASLRGQVRTLHGQVGTMQGQVSTMQGQLSTAQAQAQQAVTNANAKAASAYAARNAALNQRSASLKQREAAVRATEGQLQASQISGDGVYVVGSDIKPGIYHTNGSGDTGQNDCYFATLNSTDTSNISDNNNFDGAETVSVSGAHAFQVSGPCTWVRVG
jgi:hypothetical protein